MAEASLLDRAPVARRKLDVDEYHRMGEVGVLRDDERVELIEGQLVAMAPIGGPHTGTVVNITDALGAAVGRRAFVSVQNPVRLDRHTEPQPDVALLRRGAGRHPPKVPEAKDVLLVVEVADSSLRYDRSVKLPLYAAHGIPEVWVVNLADNLVEVCRDPGPNGYGTVIEAKPGTLIELVMVPGAVVEAADLLLE
jgi:Uma2 family endonuclease